MPTYQIEGIPVEFPHAAYPCQLAYMGKVIAALRGREHALLESPTGTGKTLGLLCAALAWRTAQVAQRQLSTTLGMGGGMVDIEDGAGGAMQKVNGNAGAVERLQRVLEACSSEGSSSQASHVSTRDFSSKATSTVSPDASKTPLIVYASRTHSQLTQVIGELRRTGYRPKIAVVGSREQLCINPNVKSLPSAAGQSAACSRLVKKRGCEFHSRLPEGMEHLKKALDGGSKDRDRCGDEGARSGHTQSQAQAASDPPIFDLEDILEFAASHRACPYYASRELLEGADLVFLPYNYLLDRKTRGSSLLNLRDAIVIFDEAHNVEGSCYDAVSAEISVEDLTLSLKELQHCQELLDSPFYAGSLKKEGIPLTMAFFNEVRRVMTITEIPQNPGFQSQPGDSVFSLLDGALRVVGPLSHIDQLLGDLEDLVKVFLEDQYNRRSAKRSSLQTITNALRTIYGESPDDDTADGLVTRESPDDPVDQQAIDRQRAVDDQARRAQARANYRMVLTLGVEARSKYQQRGSSASTAVSNLITSNSRILSYWCFNPGVVLNDLVYNRGPIRSLILTSGTLSPLQSFIQEMQINFTQILENDHVIGDDQIFASVVGVGPTNRSLNSSYQQRDNKDYQLELGRTILNFCRVIPEGVLLFFPSYQVMEGCLEFWRACRLDANPLGSGSSDGPSSSVSKLPSTPTLFHLIQEHKVIIVEPKSKGELSLALKSFERVLEDPNESRGALFMAVCRGKVSEGLDFSDGKCRGVIVTGIPYPPFKDPKIVLKRQFLQDQLQQSKQPSATLTGQEWYNQQASRAVNQALGRVIRHRNDFGAVLLCDERFAVPGTLAQLSKWLRGRVRTGQAFGEIQGSLARFFKDKPSGQLKKEIEGAAACVRTAIGPNTANYNTKSMALNSTEVKMRKFNVDGDGFLGPKTSLNPNSDSQNANDVIPVTSGSSQSGSVKMFDWFNLRNPPQKSRPSPPSKSASNNEDKQKRAQEYLDLARKTLDSAGFKQFMSLLKLYRAGQLAIDRLLSDLMKSVFSKVSNEREKQILVEGFETFVPTKHHSLYQEMCMPSRSMESKSGAVHAGHFSEKRGLHSDLMGKQVIPVEPVSSDRPPLSIFEPASNLDLRPEAASDNCPI